jgi:predicted Fe-S protein YdhL (DUF1289 family)
MVKHEVISSPCVGFCSTTYGDDYCKGCYRHFQQVISWESFNDEKKHEFYQKIAPIVTEVMGYSIEIEDQKLFEQACLIYHVRIPKDLSKHYQIYHLLQKSIKRRKTESLGLKNNTTMSWSELYRYLDKKIYQEVNKNS